ncbi:MAG TPA: TULIP family P47-like protein [Myxococcota bacterium]|nr:TULIP family P47-like protein [Myxococcota bacterium]
MTFQLLAPGPKLANTHGWDTVSALRVSELNRAIREARSSPPGFSQAVDGCDGELSGEFGDWQIDAGGDGRLVHLSIPLRNLRARYGGDSWSGDGVATVEVQLHFLPHGPLQANGESQALRLVLRTSPPKRDLPIANVVDVELRGGAEASFAISALVKLGLREWLCANLDSFTHVFATVSLSRAAAQGDFQWLEPTYATYAFLAQPNPEDSVFAILCRTGGRPADGLIEQVSPYAIPDGSHVGYLLAPERIVEDMLAPGLPVALPGLAARDVEVDAGKLQVRVERTVQLAKFEHDGRTLHPKLERLEASLRDRELVMSSTTSVEVGAGIESVCESTTFYHIGLVTKQGGTQTLGYRESRKAISHDWIRKTTGAVVLEWMLTIGGLIAGIVGFWSGAGIVIAAVLLGGVITMKVVEAVHTDDAPSIDLLVTRATGAVAWTGGEGFRLTAAELNGALQLGGEFAAKQGPR